MMYRPPPVMSHIISADPNCTFEIIVPRLLIRRKVEYEYDGDVLEVDQPSASG